jgi:hypothetical protein
MYKRKNVLSFRNVFIRFQSVQSWGPSFKKLVIPSVYAYVAEHTGISCMSSFVSSCWLIFNHIAKGGEKKRNSVLKESEGQMMVSRFLTVKTK